jgi:hypothetical protein
MAHDPATGKYSLLNVSMLAEHATIVITTGCLFAHLKLTPTCVTPGHRRLERRHRAQSRRQALDFCAISKFTPVSHSDLTLINNSCSIWVVFMQEQELLLALPQCVLSILSFTA